MSKRAVMKQPAVPKPLSFNLSYRLGNSRSPCFTIQASFPSLEENFEPRALKTLYNAFTGAEVGDTALILQDIEYDPDGQ